MLNTNGKNKANGDFDWSDAIIDSGIMAGLTFFAALGGTSVADIPTVKSMIIASVAAATQFFLSLAIKRGLREKK